MRNQNMTYYRIAIQSKQSPTWRWITTKLTSLHAVLQFLQIYRQRDFAHLRVFSATSVEALEELLALENQGGASFSVPAEQVLHEHFQVPQQAQARDEAPLEPARRRPSSTALRTPPTSDEAEAQSMSLPAGGVAMLEARRLELELGAGGDHDRPYAFAFPRTVPEIRAWIHLMAKVQHGTLEP
jgi:hypothetical protein